MKVIEMSRELGFTVGRLDKSLVRQAQTDLAQLDRDIRQQLSERKIDATTAQFCRLAIAKYGLEIQQYLIPALNEFAVACFKMAGKEALKVACAPIIREGTGYNGKPFAPIPSPFTVPEGF